VTRFQGVTIISSNRHLHFQVFVVVDIFTHRMLIVHTYRPRIKGKVLRLLFMCTTFEVRAVCYSVALRIAVNFPCL